jgi:hypothetical protein
MDTKIITALFCVMLMSPTLTPKRELNNSRQFPFVEEDSQGNSGPGIFEEYDGTKSLSQRLERLDAFALYLKHTSLHGYVISYGGRRSCRGEALSRAQFAKNYLSKVKSIDRKRITALDGGYLDKWAVQLWFGAQGQSPPTRMSTIDRRSVQIIKSCNPKTSKRKKHGGSRCEIFKR